MDQYDAIVYGGINAVYDSFLLQDILYKRTIYGLFWKYNSTQFI